MKAWNKIKLPHIKHTCCGFTYDTYNPVSSSYFRCFAHKSPKEKVSDITGKSFSVKFCITIWLVCKNNECITSFTFYYDKSNNIITKIQKSGIKYLLSLKNKFLENIPIKIKIPKIEPTSKKYLWRYTDFNPTKKLVSNIYNLDDKKVGETKPQEVNIYYEKEYKMDFPYKK